MKNRLAPEGVRRFSWSVSVQPQGASKAFIAE
jgi:hypothetical protein